MRHAHRWIGGSVGFFMAASLLVHAWTSAPNSVDPIGARMTSSGSTSIATSDFVLRSFALPPGTNGRFFFGPNPSSAPFGNGFRCVGSPSARLPILAVDGLGNAAQSLDFSGVLPVGSYGLSDSSGAAPQRSEAVNSSRPLSAGHANPRSSTSAAPQPITAPHVAAFAPCPRWLSGMTSPKTT